MRLWSLHPKYLDPQGLVALWREALLAQAVLAGKTKGYRHHPQLRRFQESPSPRRYIAAYLKEVHAEASRRGYSFDGSKIGSAVYRGRPRKDSAGGPAGEAGRAAGKVAQPPRILGLDSSLTVTRGQLQYEWKHLTKKLKKRSPKWQKQIAGTKLLKPHPLFRTVRGGVADWEIV